jgi:hypothetical protein
MQVLLSENSRLQRDISKLYSQMKTQPQKPDFTKLAKLRQARIALTAIQRACQKNNYMLLGTLYECPDLYEIVAEVPALDPYIDYIYAMVLKHSTAFMDDRAK